ncbi:MAG: baseplate J/gp47 family protein [Syntrophomonadaceae bacterium]|nr:baseplate J/gp47 family protein [Syntrophomonadaceae bacterium]
MSLPDFLTTETEDVILARLLATVSNDIDKSEGSYIYDALAAAAAELAQMKIDMQNFLARGFASTTFDEYLDYRVEEHGLERKAAVKATGTVTFTGTSGTVIPSGTVVATPADPMLSVAAIEFVTTADTTIPAGGSVNASIQATTAGENGNVLSGTITVQGTYIAGVSAVTNASATTGGENTETDTSLLARYLTKVQNPGTSGNKADYKNWALEIAGVGNAQVIPLWDGNGTVKVVLVDDDGLPVSSTIVDAVQEHISPSAGTGDGEAPVGATVTVAAATAVNINVTATIIRTGTKTLAEIKTAFETALTAYLKSIAFATDNTVRYVRIGSMILDTEGVSDYSNLQVNSGTANITISAGQVAVKGTVTLNE